MSMLLSLLFLLHSFWRCTSQGGPSVILSNGSPVIGRYNKAKTTGKPVAEFLGIPFAEPPIGDLRFRKPAQKKPWRDPFYATEPPNSCVQTPDDAFGEFQGATMWNANTKMSEDCLYLNVWVPGDIDLSRKRTVMVWVFGGGFWSGTSTLDVYDGKIFSTEEDIILVSMNYRVSVFGFLYLGSDKAPGNMGLWDQNLAFKWVKENIGKFGGDEANVTIFGESAGGASVTMHVLSKKSQPYFRRAITQSGSVTSPWALEAPIELEHRAFKMGIKLDCEAGDPAFSHQHTWDLDKLHQCFMSKTAEQLRDAEWVATSGFLDFPWTPTVDGDFLDESPKSLLERGDFKNTELLAGSNREESNFFIVYQLHKIYPKNELFHRDEFIFNDSSWAFGAQKLIPKAFKDAQLVKDAILHEYWPWELPAKPRAYQDSLDKMTGDYFFLCNVNEFAQYFAEHGGSTYYFYFTHRSTQQTWPEWMGVLHGYEINFIFGEPLNEEDYKYTTDEQALARKFMHYWANFARTGNPNKAGASDDSWAKVNDKQLPYWPQYNKASQKYMTMDIDSSDIGVGPRRKQCTFWKYYLPRLMVASAHLTKEAVDWADDYATWKNEYLVEWKTQFERYKQYQAYSRYDLDMRQSCARQP